MKPNSRRDFIKKSAFSGSALLLSAYGGFPASVLGNNVNGLEGEPDLSQLGLLDITSAPYNADPEGMVDSTLAIQKAINDARDKRMVCFFPSGTYLISDTLSCEVPVYKLPIPGVMQGQFEDECGRYQGGDNKKQHYWNDGKDKIVLLGSTKGSRPVLKLMSGAGGFNNPSKPKYAVYIWAQTRNDRGGAVSPTDPCKHATPLWGVEQPNINFNNVFKGIDIDLGNNPGAIGLRFSGSQGCFLMDSKVNATGAHAGFNNCPGQGGGTYNLEVEGGEYGIKIEATYRFPLLASCSFVNQTKACIQTAQSTGLLPLVMAGCYFKPANGGVPVDLSLSKSYPGISLVDCAAILESQAEFIKTGSGGENIYLENCYVKGVNKLHSYDGNLILSNKWVKLIHYAFCKTGSKNLINGSQSNETRFDWEETQAPDIKELWASHWSVIPSFEDDDVVNVRDFGATGNGSTDDTTAFELALAASNKVFVPKGTYKTSRTIVLGKNKHIFGIPKVYSALTSDISTVDDADAVCGLYFFRANNINWRSGKGIFLFGDGNISLNNSGGGRFYGLKRQKTLGNNTSPISIYSYNIERVTSNPMSEIVNGKNIRIFYLKVEAGTVKSGNGNDYNTPMRVSNSDNVRIYGVSGVTKTKEGRPMVEVVNSNNTLVSQVKSLDTSALSAPTFKEVYNSVENVVPKNVGLSLFLRNDLGTSMRKISASQFEVSPNPFKCSFKVGIPEGFTKLKVTNVKSEVMFSKDVEGLESVIINALENKASGLYYLTLSSLRDVITKKLIKY